MEKITFFARPTAQNVETDRRGPACAHRGSPPEEVETPRQQKGELGKPVCSVRQHMVAYQVYQSSVVRVTVFQRFLLNGFCLWTVPTVLAARASPVLPVLVAISFYAVADKYFLPTRCNGRRNGRPEIGVPR